MAVTRVLLSPCRLSSDVSVSCPSYQSNVPRASPLLLLSTQSRTSRATRIGLSCIYHSDTQHIQLVRAEYVCTLLYHVQPPIQRVDVPKRTQFHVLFSHLVLDDCPIEL